MKVWGIRNLILTVYKSNDYMLLEKKWLNVSYDKVHDKINKVQCNIKTCLVNKT